MVVVVEKNNACGSIDTILSKFIVCAKEDLKTKDLSLFEFPVYTENPIILSKAMDIESYFDRSK